MDACLEHTVYVKPGPSCGFNLSPIAWYKAGDNVTSESFHMFHSCFHMCCLCKWISQCSPNSYKRKVLAKNACLPFTLVILCLFLILFLLWVLKLLLWFYFPECLQPGSSKLSIQNHCLRTMSPFMSSLNSLPPILFMVFNICSCTQCKLRPPMTSSIPPTQNLVIGFLLWLLSFSYLQLMKGKKMPLSTIV